MARKGKGTSRLSPVDSEMELTYTSHETTIENYIKYIE